MQKKAIKAGCLTALVSLLLPAGLFAQEQDEVKVKLYGFVKANAITADGPVHSWGGENLIGPTTVKRKTEWDDNTRRWQILSHESRFGINPSYGDKWKGIIEFDLVGDFGRSQPSNSNTLVRTRKIHVNYTPTKDIEIFMGQMGDIFSPYGPSTFNIANYMFEQGNVGNLRDQAGFRMNLLPAMSLTAGVGMTGANKGSGDPLVGVELNPTPTYAASFELKPAQGLKFNISFIYADIVASNAGINNTLRKGQPLYYNGDPELVNSYLMNELSNVNAINQEMALYGKSQKVRADGISIGGDMDLSDTLKVAFEATYGHGLAALGTVSSASGGIKRVGFQDDFKNNPLYYMFNTGDEQTDAGLAAIRNGDFKAVRDYKTTEEAAGWLQISVKLGGGLSTSIYSGVSKILNPEVLGSESVANLSTSNTQSHRGYIKENQTFGWNLTKNLAKNLDFFVELQQIRTHYHDSKAVTDYRFIKSIDAQSGALVTNLPLTYNNGELQYIAVRGQYPDYWLADATSTANIARVGMMAKF